MNNLTRRGWIVLGVAIGLGVALLLWVSANLWWTGEGYCIGSLVKCFH